MQRFTNFSYKFNIWSIVISRFFRLDLFWFCHSTNLLNWFYLVFLKTFDLNLFLIGNLAGHNLVNIYSNVWGSNNSSERRGLSIVLLIRILCWVPTKVTWYSRNKQFIMVNKWKLNHLAFWFSPCALLSVYFISLAFWHVVRCVEVRIHFMSIQLLIWLRTDCCFLWINTFRLVFMFNFILLVVFTSFWWLSCVIPVAFSVLMR